MSMFLVVPLLPAPCKSGCASACCLSQVHPLPHCEQPPLRAPKCTRCRVTARSALARLVQVALG